MLNSVLPKYKDLIIPSIGRGTQDEDRKLYLSTSADSLKLIFTKAIAQKNASTLKIAVPAFFCGETLHEAWVKGVQYVYYLIDDNLDPVWDDLKNICDSTDVDLLLFCHFFGSFHGINRIKNYCAQKKIVLIEDCAHVLYRGKEFGKKGDFVLYSPHKTLPIPDGAILDINPSKIERISCLQKSVTEDVPTERRDVEAGWRAKKLFQKTIGIQKKISWRFEPHLYSCEKSGAQRPIQGISAYSRNILKSYSEKKLKQAVCVRRDNYELLNNIVKQIAADVRAIPFSGDGAPYVAAFDLSIVKNKESIEDRLGNLGIYGVYWPDLPQEIEDGERYAGILRLSKNMVCYPVHQGIATDKYAKILASISKDNDSTHSSKIEIHAVKNKDDYEIWSTILDDISVRNIPQESLYGDIKADVEHWSVDRYIIYIDGNAAGLLQALIKRFKGAALAVRINRGPLMLDKYRNSETVFRILDALRKIYHHPIPILYASDLRFSVEHLADAVRYGWRARNLFGFSSGLIDLGDDVDEIRARFDGKWRNQLVSVEKKGVEILKDGSRFDECVSLYENDQKEKGYKGVPTRMLYGMWRDGRSPLRLYRIENPNGDIIAFDVFYFGSNFGLYLVGWNGPEGRKIYANNLLLYSAVIDSKERGAKWFDLGGIDFIETPENAMFKMGLRPTLYRTLGEYISF